MSRSSFQFPDGAILSVATITCQDTIHEAVHITYIHPSSPNSVMELALPPNSAELLIRALQERTNEARFINGEKLLDYPVPKPIDPVAALRAAQQRRKKKRTDRQAVGRDCRVHVEDDTTSEPPQSICPTDRR